MFRPKRAPTIMFLAMSTAAAASFTHFIVEGYRVYYETGHMNHIGIRYRYYAIILFAPIVLFAFASATATRLNKVACAAVCKVSIAVLGASRADSWHPNEAFILLAAPVILLGQFLISTRPF